MNNQASENKVLITNLMYDGTWLLPIPYEGSLWDELYAVSAPRMKSGGSAEMILSSDAIIIKRLFGDRIVIPLDQICGMRTCSFKLSGKIPGKDAVLRIVWKDNDEIKCSSITTCSFSSLNAVQCKKKIEEIIGCPKWIVSEITSDYKKQLALIKAENHLVSGIFFSALLAAILIHVSFCPIFLFVFADILIPLATGIFVYNRRYKHLGILRPKGFPKIINFLIFMLILMVPFIVVFTIFWLNK